MSRSFTRAELRTRSRFHADLEGDDVGVLNARVNELLDLHKTAVYRRLAQAGPPDHYSSDTTVSVTSGTLTYALPADFWFETAVLAVDGVKRRPLTNIEGRQRAAFVSPTASYSVTVEYVPRPAIWTSDSDTFDGIAGLEEPICLFTARDLLGKEESHERWQQLDALGSRALAEALSYARRSRGPRPITDERDEYFWDWFSTSPAAYRLRGANIEIYERRVVP